MLRILQADLDDPQVVALLQVHAEAARAQTAAGSAHALDIAALRARDLHVRAAWDGPQLAGIGALRILSPTDGELKSMHTAATHRRRGVGRAMLLHLVDLARTIGLERVSLETGSWEYFAPARALYRAHGFVECAPFGDYRADPNSVFLTRTV
jgi:putative acetyltransferase